MTRRRLEYLQWFALFGGPWAWATQHVLEFGVSNAHCSLPVAYWNVPNTALHILIVCVIGATVLAAEGAAFLVFRATSDVGEYEPGPYGRLRFFAQAALLGNVLFLMIVILDFVGSVHHGGCGQA